MTAQKKEKEESEVPEFPEREELIKKVLRFLEDYSGSTVEDIADAFKVSQQKAYQALEALKGRGEIVSEYVEDLYFEVYKLSED